MSQESDYDSIAFSRRLIDLVSQQSILFSPYHPERKNRTTVDNTWLCIATQLNSEGKFCCIAVWLFFVQESFRVISCNLKFLCSCMLPMCPIRPNFPTTFISNSFSEFSCFYWFQIKQTHFDPKIYWKPIIQTIITF